MKILNLTLFLLLVFGGCGPEPKEIVDVSTNEGPYLPAAPVEYDADFYAFQGKAFSFDGTSLFSEDVSSGYTYTLENNPGFITLNATTGEMTGETEEQGLYTDIKIVATKIVDASIKSQTFSVALNGDPLRVYMWNVKNTGQSSFSNSGGVSGIDLNLYNVWKEGTTGSGIKVAVSDSGVEINHDDLYQNALEGEHRNYSLNSPYIGVPTPTSTHGTAVTGIIAAKGWNNIGILGIAPNAKFAGFQFLDSSQSTSILVHQANGDFDVYNYSYGDTIFEDTRSDALYIDHLRDSTLNDSKVYVKAAGNEFKLGDGTLCAPHNANLPFENESYFMLVVGAINADGVKSTYSNAGSNIWISAPGGEYGISYPAILTTDLPTCLKGYSKASGSQYNDFEYEHSLNPKCNYTSTMNGTSAATPHISGIVALLKSVNSSLKMRDIKHILASTAVRINPNHDNNYFGKEHPSKKLSGCDDLNLTGYEYEQGWIQNSAGFWFNNFYGFGLVDAEAAVNMAKTYTSSLGTAVELNPGLNDNNYRSVSNQTIPDANATGITNTINITSNITVEAVQIRVVATHNRSGELGIELTSPSGIKSILLNINNSLLFEDDSNLNITLVSNAFYGEPSQGNWTIRVVDGLAGTAEGKLDEWHINILGHN